MNTGHYFNWLEENLQYCLVSCSFDRKDITLVVKKEFLIPVIFFLKIHSNCQFKVLSDLAVVDFPHKNKRFTVVYQLLSIYYNCRVTVKVQVSEDDSVQSICEVYKAASWYEREAYDLFGVFFSGHPDLRRILTDYGFEGHPIRKDFPLSGFHEARFSHEKKRVVIEPIALSQEFRSFSYNTAKQLIKPAIFQKKSK